MRQDTVTVRLTRVGLLAAELFGAQTSLLRAEHDLEALLDSLFMSWGDFESGLEDFSIDVYEVIAAPSAIDALQRAGFLTVTLHDHPRSSFLTCACRVKHST